MSYARRVGTEASDRGSRVSDCLATGVFRDNCRSLGHIRPPPLGRCHGPAAGARCVATVATLLRAGGVGIGRRPNCTIPMISSESHLSRNRETLSEPR